MSEKPEDSELLAIARDLVAQLEEGNNEKVDACIAQLTDLRESHLFRELGKLTREFHEALNSFRYDERINSLAQEEIPDARERLSYVITKTDEAAHRTLNAIEAVTPVCDALSDTIGSFGKTWEKFTHRELNPAQFRDLSRNLQAFFVSAGNDMDMVKNNLNDVLMAQDFQDITGQIIKRVIKLVSEVESSLVELIKLGGSSIKRESEGSVNTGGLDGPQVPGMEGDNVVSGQNEVDDLLSSFGF
ncbi:MAG: protein phosphatase CheZ [Gammaproteobacteria bacterium]|nr:protein phosphatase CheZ [Gammaproteobacteria bacterium]